MADLKELLEPKNDIEHEEETILDLLLQVQLELQLAMELRGVRQKDLADALGVSEARISQVFSSLNPNLTIKTIGRIAHALGGDFAFTKKSRQYIWADVSAENAAHAEQVENKEVSRCNLTRRMLGQRHGPWRDTTANDNRFPNEEAA